MNDVISKLLKEMHERDQKERQELIKNYGSKLSFKVFLLSLKTIKAIFK